MHGNKDSVKVIQDGLKRCIELLEKAAKEGLSTVEHQGRNAPKKVIDIAALKGCIHE